MNFGIRENMVDGWELKDSISGLVVYRLGEREFCADIEEVTAIINPYFLNEPVDLHSGISSINIHKMKIPVLDLHKFFTIDRNSKYEDKRILAVETFHIIFGFIVDEVKEIFSLENENRTKIILSKADDPFIKKIIWYQGRGIYLPDYGLLLRKMEEENWSGVL